MDTKSINQRKSVLQFYRAISISTMLKNTIFYYNIGEQIKSFKVKRPTDNTEDNNTYNDLTYRIIINLNEFNTECGVLSTICLYCVWSIVRTIHISRIFKCHIIVICIYTVYGDMRIPTLKNCTQLKKKKTIQKSQSHQMYIRIKKNTN